MKKLSLLSKNYYQNKDLILEELIDAIKTLLKKREDILKIVIFGSIITNKFSLGSDADILIILKSSNEKRFFDRTPEFLEFFNKNTSIPVDLFIYTIDEIEKMIYNNNPLIKSALKNGIHFDKIST